MTKKRILIAALSLTLCIGLLTACGSSSNKKQADTLDRNIIVAAFRGTGTDILKHIGSGYQIQSDSQLKKVESRIKKGDYDVAVIPTMSAAKLYGKTKGNLVEISPTSMDGIYLLSNQYTLANGKLSSLASKTIYITGENATATRVFQYLMSQAGYRRGSYRMKALNDYGEIAKALKDDGNIAVVAEPDARKIRNENSNVIRMMDLAKQWTRMTSLSLPRDVVIAKATFATQHPAALQQFIQDYARAEKKTRSAGTLVFYANTNRGTSLLKAFNQEMEHYSSDLFGKRSLRPSLYYEEN